MYNNILVQYIVEIIYLIYSNKVPNYTYIMTIISLLHKL